MKLSPFSLTAAITCLSVGSNLSAWVLLDNFESLAPGSLVDGSTGAGVTWDGGSTVTAEVDPSNASNTALKLAGTAGNQVIRGQFSGGNITAGNTGTVFYRFRTPDSSLGGTTDAVVALTDNAAVTNFNFKSGLRNTIPAGTNNMDVRNGGSYEQVSLLGDSTWYNMWMVTTNTDPGTFELYIQSDTDATFATQTKLATSTPDDNFDYRINGPTDIVNFYIRGASNAGGTADSNLYYDDIYLSANSVDLTNPTIPEPTAPILVALGSLMALRRRR
ncbi:MAG: hypothetical protein ACSHYF_13940 [Verrucomicrobiaceae bacterium]